MTSETTKNVPSGKDRRSSPKKKKHKTSKHVLKSQQQRNKEAKGSGNTGSGGRQKGKARKSKGLNVRDPGEASAYLAGWKRHQHAKKEGGDGGGDWKFSKNTQSWLIRHMYDVDKVSKTTFCLLLEYLLGLKGGDAKSRILDDATTRARRYKDYESRKKAAAAGGGVTKDEEAEDDEGRHAEEGRKRGVGAAGDAEDDASRWEKLSDHDKRKEYKRARKVLEHLGRS